MYSTSDYRSMARRALKNYWWLAVGVTLLCCWLLKKKVSPIAIIIGMFAIGIVGHLIGLL